MEYLENKDKVEYMLDILGKALTIVEELGDTYQTAREIREQFHMLLIWVSDIKERYLSDKAYAEGREYDG